MLPTNKFTNSPTNINNTGQVNGTAKVFRHRSPQPAKIYYEQKKQLSPEVQYQSQASGILQGTASLSFGISHDSTWKPNMNLVQAKTYNNEGRYRGQINQDKLPHGYGTYYYLKQKYEYTGSFQNGKPHGRGILYRNLDSNSNKIKIYQGEWKNGLKNGNGKYYYSASNNYYEGPWVDDQRHGKQGTYVSPIGRYVGQWKYGKMMGKGQLYVNKTNTRYIGEFINNEFSEGIIIYQNGDTFQGKVLNGLRHDNNGLYKYKGSENLNFVGNWQKDLKHDNQMIIDPTNSKDRRKQLTKGAITYSNGQTLKGSFDFNKFRYGQACSYKWMDGDILNGWLKQSSTGYLITGTIKKSDGKQYEVR